MPTTHPMSDVAPAPFAPVVSRALDGDPTAWPELVERLKRPAWKVVVSFRLEPEEANDAFATTMLRLYEYLGKVREPEKLPSWITTVARNEVHAILRARRRSDAVALLVEPGAAPSAEDEIDQDADLRPALRQAFEQLPELWQRLLLLVMTDPPTPYAEISATLGIPVGSIGPTRQRCLEHLRRSAALAPHLKGTVT
jgi:RNA polymerase sigma factor (sigma-70 family)